MPSSLRNVPPPSPAAAPKAGLTVSKVIAGAGAAATSAVAGSVFGADGTVVGAAVGSVVSAVAAVAYERSLDRTRQVVVSRVRLPNGRTSRGDPGASRRRDAGDSRPATCCGRSPRHSGRSRTATAEHETSAARWWHRADFPGGSARCDGCRAARGRTRTEQPSGRHQCREGAGGRHRFWFPGDHHRLAGRNHDELSDWHGLVGHADDGRASESCCARLG